MNIGMLWFDNDPKDELNIKIERAANYYRSKYGSNPTLCFVHPCMLPSETTENGPALKTKNTGIEIRSNRSILPNHFWLGVNGVKPGVS
jgi:hypothetical protein